MISVGDLLFPISRLGFGFPRGPAAGNLRPSAFIRGSHLRALRALRGFRWFYLCESVFICGSIFSVVCSPFLAHRVSPCVGASCRMRFFLHFSVDQGGYICLSCTEHRRLFGLPVRGRRPGTAQAGKVKHGGAMLSELCVWQTRGGPVAAGGAGPVAWDGDLLGLRGFAGADVRRLRRRRLSQLLPEAWGADRGGWAFGRRWGLPHPTDAGEVRARGPGGFRGAEQVQMVRESE